MVYFETPVNPTLELIDIAAVRKAVRSGQPPRAEDRRSASSSTTPSPRPSASARSSLGADVVVHSLTKGIGGFGTDMGGAVLAAEKLRTS